MDLVKEEMLVWSESVGESLERLIRKKKGSGSVPPPPFVGPGMPAMPAIGGHGALPTDAEVAMPRNIAPYSPPSIIEYPQGDVDPLVPDVPAPPPASNKMLISAAAGFVLVAAVSAGVWWRFSRSDGEVDRIVVPATKLAGFPNAVEPSARVPFD